MLFRSPKLRAGDASPAMPPRVEHDLLEATAAQLLLLASGGEALFADPRRKDAPLFLELMEERGFLASTEDVLVEQGGREVKVLVHRLRR